MNTVSELVKKNPMLVTVALAVAVILVIYMLWQGCMIMGIRLRTPAEGMGAGGPQVNDNALLPAGWEGYHVRRLEGVTGKDFEGTELGNASIRAALAVENARELRRELQCKPASHYVGMDARQLTARGSAANPEAAGWALEGMTGTSAKLRDAMQGL